MSDDGSVVTFTRRKVNEWPKQVYLADFGDGDGCRPYGSIQRPDDTTPLYVRGDIHSAAQYRIEELEAKLTTCEKYRDAYAECDRIGTQAVRDLEAKLAEAMRHVAEYSNDPHLVGWARRNLAELTGGDDE